MCLGVEVVVILICLVGVVVDVEFVVVFDSVGDGDGLFVDDEGVWLVVVVVVDGGDVVGFGFWDVFVLFVVVVVVEVDEVGRGEVVGGIIGVLCIVLFVC